MVVTKRFTPVGESEVGIQRLGCFEFADRLLPAEAVQRANPAQEVGLGFGFARVREGQSAYVLESGRVGNGRHQEQGNERGTE